MNLVDTSALATTVLLWSRNATSISMGCKFAAVMLAQSLTQTQWWTQQVVDALLVLPVWCMVNRAWSTVYRMMDDAWCIV